MCACMLLSASVEVGLDKCCLRCACPRGGAHRLKSVTVLPRVASLGQLHQGHLVYALGSGCG